MSTTRLTRPVPDDLVVLPGMVVPIELDDAARAAVDAARAQQRRHAAGRSAAGGPLRLVRRGRLDRAARPAADRRTGRGASRPSAASGSAPVSPVPGTALWVEAEELEDRRTTPSEVRKLAAEYKSLVIATLQRRDAWQIIDTVNRVTDPSALADLAGYAP